MSLALDRQLVEAHAHASAACGSLLDAREELRCLVDPVAGPAAVRAAIDRARRAHGRLTTALAAVDLALLDARKGA